MNNKDKKFILWFEEIGIEDVPLVGGKNASLGEMFSNLTKRGVQVPNGFAVTSYAYQYFLEKAGLKNGIHQALEGLDTRDIRNLQVRGDKVRKLILKASLPEDLQREIIQAYYQLGVFYQTREVDVAVRSSATAEDLPGSSFAGQQETYLNIKGEKAILEATKKCIASLFTDRAISYREDKGFSHFDVSLSVTIQKMVRSDLAASGVAFTLDTETGFEDVVVVNGAYGLGEMVVQGQVTPDEFIVFKPTLKQGYKSLISKNLGQKKEKLIYSPKGTKKVSVPEGERKVFCLTDAEVLELATWCVKIEEYFSEKRGGHQPMDIEWAKDGKTNRLFIVQARPETVHASADKNIYKEYRLESTSKLLLQGTAVGMKVATGKVRVIKSAKKISEFKKGEVLVTEITDPDWEPIMKIASAIVTDKGGRTSHAAIVSRELGIPCIVGSEKATQVLKNGMEVTVDCSSGDVGKIYEGILPFETREHHLDKVPETKTHIMVNIGSPDEAFQNHFLPARGVGLGRLEFIIASHIRLHPNLLLDFEKLKLQAKKDKKIKSLVSAVEDLTYGYKDKADFYVDELAEGIAKIGAAFYPHPVIIRFSDFKTNEYRTLLGGDLYEPHEENPMIGWRGASRYHHENFKRAFGLECRALLRVRKEFGLTNVIPMIPFCRTPEEGAEVIKIMEANGLKRSEDKDLKVYVMCEIPANVIRADDFLDVFDGMSIGSNDLSQLTLGIDRDSNIVSKISNENDLAVKRLIESVIERCRARGKYIGICGQAPSDYPEFAKFLVERGIESISLNPDTVIKAVEMIAEKEKEVA